MMKFVKKIPITKLFPLLSLGLFLLIIALTVLQVRQSQNLQSNAATDLTECTIAQQAIANDAEETSLKNKINNYRSENNLPPLTFQEDLNRAAAWLSNDMANKNSLGHIDSTGRPPSARIQNCGYMPMGFYAENVAKGQEDAQNVLSDWVESENHRKNLLCTKCTQIGIARQKSSKGDWFWTMDVGSLQPATSPTTPTTPSPTTVTPKPTDKDNSSTPSPSPEVTLPPAKTELPEGTTGMNAYIYLPGTYDATSDEIKHPNRPLTVTIFTLDDKEVAKVDGIVSYDDNEGYFKGAIAFPDTLETGTYIIKVKTDYSITKIVNSGFVAITKGKVLDPDYVTLPNIDLNEDNTISFRDVQQFTKCLSTEVCSADLNDDGTMNILDYNAFIEAFGDIEGQ